MSWEKELISRRLALTGESPQVATEALRASGLALPVTELPHLRRLVRQQILPAPFDLDFDRAATVRPALLPDAATQPQIDLEAELLEAVSRAVNHLHTHPNGSLTRPAAVIQSVTPLPDRLQLRVNPIAVAPLLYEAIPFEFEEAVSGIVGLRAKPHRRSTELFLVDAPEARVELIGVGRTAWRAAQAYRLARNCNVDTGKFCAETMPNDLSPAESEHLASYSRAFGPVRIASGILRRIAVLNTATWVQTWSTGCAHFNIEWPGETPYRPHVSLLLADPLFGIHGAEIGNAPNLKFNNASATCTHRNLCTTHHLRFRSSGPVAEADESDLIRALKANARPEWNAWHRALAKE